MLTQKYLKKIISYNPETGVFVWKESRPGIYVGAIAGSLDNGYVRIKINFKPYSAHRLAWLYEYGCFPNCGLDHIDRVRHHNWIDNLREATQQCNIRNTSNYNTNTSGIKGVCWNNSRKKWTAYIYINNKCKHLGHHDTKTEAVCFRLAGEQCLNWSGCDNNSPALQYVKKYINSLAC